MNRDGNKLNRWGGEIRRVYWLEICKYEGKEIKDDN